MPTVENFEASPEFNTDISEFGSGKIVRNAKWSTPRYKFRIKYRVPMRKADVTAIKDFYVARKGKFESFELNVPPLGSTFTVIFAVDDLNFDYFFDTLSNFGSVSFIEEVT